MSDHGADAKVLTTADVESLPEHGDEDGGMPGVVLVDLDDLLATTRALETAQEQLRHAADAHPHSAELRCQLAHAASVATRLERERDEARGEARAHRAALDAATAPCHGLGCGRCEDCVSMQRARAENAEAERDAARRELAELALEVGYGERPEGQGHIIHASGPELARAWLLERKGRDDAECWREEARVTFAELVEVLEGLAKWGEAVRKRAGVRMGDPHTGGLDAARAAIAKAKGAANG